MTKKENFVAIKSALNEVGISTFDEFIAGADTTLVKWTYSE